MAAAQLLPAAGALGAGLARAAPTGRPVLLFLPNTPTFALTILATLGAGRQPLPVDPRAPLDELAEILEAHRPALAIALDIGAVLDKLMRLLAAVPAGVADDMAVRVARFAPELPFPRNLLFPLLRGGGLANLPDDPRFARLEALAGAAGQAAEPAPDPASAWGGALLCGGRAVGQVELAADAALATAQARAGGPAPRWLLTASLAEPRALAALFGALAAPATLLLSPRLDAKSLDKLAKQSGATRRVPD